MLRLVKCTLCWCGIAVAVNCGPLDETGEMIGSGACDDGSACTAFDQVVNGLCRGREVLGCRTADIALRVSTQPCAANSDCDLGLACTDDYCIDGACAHMLVELPGCMVSECVDSLGAQCAPCIAGGELHDQLCGDTAVCNPFSGFCRARGDHN